MKIFSRTFARSLLFLFVLCVAPLVCVAQESGTDQPPAASRKSDARPALNEQQKSGEAIFVQNCTLCHMQTNQKKRLKIQASSLEGMFGQDSDSDALRQFIQQGVPKMMPSFRFGLDQQQIDDLIAYLKTGAHLKASTGGN